MQKPFKSNTIARPHKNKGSCPLFFFLDPLEAYNQITTGEPAYVKISRPDQDVARVWRTSDKANWSGLTGKILVDGTNPNANTWDLTNQTSHTRFEHDMGSLFVEGRNPGTTTLTLELEDSSHTVLLSDTLVVNPWGVEILVNNTASTADDIVCRHSTTPAARPEIPCQLRLLGGVASMNLYLENGGAGGSGQLCFGATAGTATAGNLTINSVPAGNPGAPQTFYISGETESALMWDTVIRVKQNNAAGDVYGEAKVSVLWVLYTPTDPKTGENGFVSRDSAAYAGILASFYTRGGNGELGGPRKFNDRIGMGCEFRGEVYPRDYDPSQFGGNMILSDREVIQVGMWKVDAAGANPAVINAVAGPIPDLGPNVARDDQPLQNGYIYDFDNPGPTVYAAAIPVAAFPVGHFAIQRANFRAIAAFGARITDGGAGVRCSDDFFWTSSVTAERTASGTADDWAGGTAPNVTRQNEAIGSYTQAAATVGMVVSPP